MQRAVSIDSLNLMAHPSITLVSTDQRRQDLAQELSDQNLHVLSEIILNSPFDKEQFIVHALSAPAELCADLSLCPTNILTEKGLDLREAEKAQRFLRFFEELESFVEIEAPTQSSLFSGEGFLAIRKLVSDEMKRDLHGLQKLFSLTDPEPEEVYQISTFADDFSTLVRLIQFEETSGSLGERLRQVQTSIETAAIDIICCKEEFFAPMPNSSNDISHTSIRTSIRDSGEGFLGARILDRLVLAHSPTITDPDIISRLTDTLDHSGITSGAISESKDMKEFLYQECLLAALTKIAPDAVTPDFWLEISENDDFVRAAHAAAVKSQRLDADPLFLRLVRISSSERYSEESPSGFYTRLLSATSAHFEGNTATDKFDEEVLPAEHWGLQFCMGEGEMYRQTWTILAEGRIFALLDYQAQGDEAEITYIDTQHDLREMKAVVKGISVIGEGIDKTARKELLTFAKDFPLYKKHLIEFIEEGVEQGYITLEASLPPIPEEI